MLNCLSSADGSKPVLETKEVSFGIYMVGFIILIIGLSMGAYLMHVPPKWIGVGVVTMVGLGILLGVTSTRRRDSSQ
ncbi:MAG TPA: hypothetical protein VKB79_02240 [Bryobacteraceae bacterium]|nr:hypothetical protein [Bryobacteraceae bacterium]